ncbi:US12 family protein [Halopiger goleimassiliensis]|uniref:US12 family protein n=1 Tax=Halopiger goleimassiliensis TaxID=1293048 RepID=UPI0006778259|nr:US12 family protein [Halopiger goleimassiliensis]
MSSVETPHETGRGFGLSSRELQVIGGASGLMAITVALMYVFVATPLATINDSLFRTAPIVGVLVYGAALFVGELIAERGIKSNDIGIAFVGTTILVFAFAVFGAGVLSYAPRALQLTILGVTAIVTAVLTALISGYVYARSTTFEHWGRYANVAFIGGLVVILVGSFVLQPLLLVGFVLIFLGFLLRLGYEIWQVRDRRDASIGLQTLGVYIAVAGVFVHVLQLVMRYVLSQE